LDMGRAKSDRRSAAPSEPATQGRPHLLVVEPEALLRWATVTYLGRWFDVRQSATAAEARRLLRTFNANAVVVSGELGSEAADAIEARVRARNPGARVVRTVTDPTDRDRCPTASVCIEKPFRLSDLADLLGVGQPGRRG